MKACRLESIDAHEAWIKKHSKNINPTEECRNVITESLRQAKVMDARTYQALNHDPGDYKDYYVTLKSRWKKVIGDYKVLQGKAQEITDVMAVQPQRYEESTKSAAQKSSAADNVAVESVQSQPLPKQQEQQQQQEQVMKLHDAIVLAKKQPVGSASNRYGDVKECMNFVSDKGAVEAVWQMLNKHKGAFNEHRGWGQLFGKYAGATTTWKAVVGAFVDRLNDLDKDIINSVDSDVFSDIQSACEDCVLGFDLTQDSQPGRSPGTHG